MVALAAWMILTGPPIGTGSRSLSLRPQRRQKGSPSCRNEAPPGARRLRCRERFPPKASPLLLFHANDYFPFGPRVLGLTRPISQDDRRSSIYISWSLCDLHPTRMCARRRSRRRRTQSSLSSKGLESAQWCEPPNPRSRADCFVLRWMVMVGR